MSAAKTVRGVRFLGREDEMLTFHRDGAFWCTLYAPSPEHAAELAAWFTKKNRKREAALLAHARRLAVRQYEESGVVRVVLDGRTVLQTSFAQLRALGRLLKSDQFQMGRWSAGAGVNIEGRNLNLEMEWPAP